jgi:hypothetical protein
MLRLNMRALERLGRAGYIQLNAKDLSGAGDHSAIVNAQSSSTAGTKMIVMQRLDSLRNTCWCAYQCCSPELLLPILRTRHCTTAL